MYYNLNKHVRLFFYVFSNSHIKCFLFKNVSHSKEPCITLMYFEVLDKNHNYFLHIFN